MTPVKKLVLGIMLFALLFIIGFADAQQRTATRSSGLKSVDAAIATTGGALTGVLVLTDGTNDATIVVYDHASAASGTVLFKGKVAGASNFGGATFEVPLRYSNGVYADVTGTGANYIIYYISGF